LVVVIGLFPIELNQNHIGFGVASEPKCELAEVLVERDNNATFRLRATQRARHVTRRCHPRAAARRVAENTAFRVEQTDGNEKSSLDGFAGNVKESTDLSWRAVRDDFRNWLISAA
jgi:hypothetical protein